MRVKSGLNQGQMRGELHISLGPNQQLRHLRVIVDGSTEQRRVAILWEEHTPHSAPTHPQALTSLSRSLILSGACSTTSRTALVSPCSAAS